MIDRVGSFRYLFVLVVGFALAQGVDDVTDDQVMEAVARMAIQCASQEQTMQDLVAALNSGNLTEARSKYIDARPQYEQMEVMAPSFEDLDRDIDARPYVHEDGELDPAFKGFHVIEYMLFRNEDLESAKPVAAALQEDIAALCETFNAPTTRDFNRRKVWDGLLALVVEVPAKKISSEEETWSDQSVLIFVENLNGIWAVAEPFLVELSEQVQNDVREAYEACLQTLEDINLPSDDRKYRVYSDLSMNNRGEIVSSFYTFATALFSAEAEIFPEARKKTKWQWSVLNYKDPKSLERFSRSYGDFSGDMNYVSRQSDSQMEEAVLDGVRYFSDLCPTLLSQVEDLSASLSGNSPDVSIAREMYTKARPIYEQTEVLAASFEEEDTKIDARPYAFPLGELDPDYEGFHVIEKALFREENVTTALTFSRKLESTVNALCKKLDGADNDQKNFNVENSFAGMRGLAIEIGAKKISSEEETYSDLSLMIYRENFKGIDSQLRPFFSLLQENLIEEIEKKYTEIQELFENLDPDYGFDKESAIDGTGLARAYSTLTTEERADISTAAYEYAALVTESFESVVSGDRIGPDTTATEDPTATMEEDPAPTMEEDPAPTMEEDPAPTMEEDPAPTMEEDPAPTAEEDPTATPEGSATPTPEESPTPTSEESPTSTPEGSPTSIPEGSPTPTPEGSPTPIPEGSPTSTPEGSPTSTPEGSPLPIPEGSPTPTPEENPTPTPTTAAENTVCFPGSSLVQTELRGAVSMAELQVGDRVLTSRGWSDIFFFGHMDPLCCSTFLVLYFDVNRKITLSPEHLLPTAVGKLIPAKEVKLGSNLRSGGGEIVTVKRIETTIAQGLFNPHTEEGDIVVDGIVASCYTSIIPAGLARLLLEPIRFAYKRGFALGPVLDNMPRRAEFLKLASSTTSWGRLLLSRIL